MLIDGEFVDVCAILCFAITELIDEAVKQGAQRAEIERTIILTVQNTIAISRSRYQEHDIKIAGIHGEFRRREKR